MTAPELVELLLSLVSTGRLTVEGLLPMSLTVLSMAIISAGGWVWETIYCSIVERHLTRRGVLFGPSCPIYGVGAVIIYLLLGWSDSIVLVFVLGALLATLIEYATGSFLYKRYHRRWWDYSTWPLNYKGHVCVAASAVFGLFSVLVVFLIEPALVDGLSSFGAESCFVAATTCLVAYAVDVLATLVSLDERKSQRVRRMRTKVVSKGRSLLLR